MSSLNIEDIFLQIRDKLQKNGVKLWMPPYYTEKDGSSTKDLQVLATEYSQQLGIDIDSCCAALTELQERAIVKLKQRDHFKQSGLATIKIKILGQSDIKTITKEILLSIAGSELKAYISEEIKIPTDRIKLIANGLVLKDSVSLGEQGVSNENTILALTMNISKFDLKESENQIRDVELTKTDTHLLATDNSYMELEDQHGNVIKIPAKEKRALMVAMALHERGKTALKKDDYARALIFFLDADKEFGQCTSQLLRTTDNYALLDLDIAWCYLCLQSFSSLPEAERRLKRCEEVFHKSYGPNLERVVALKGSSGNESALYMRLHLMQAIVLYHQNKRNEALELFRKSQTELLTLKVNKTDLVALVELGYSTAEARIGLRATHGDVNQAANYINENRTRRSEARRKALAESILMNEKKKLGKCVDGKQYVDPNFLNMLVNMGYNKNVAREALQQSNNIISSSIEYIHDHPQPGPSNTKSVEFLSLLQDLVPELIAAGFDENMSQLALQKHKGDVMKAAEELLNNNGQIEGNLENFLADIDNRNSETRADEVSNSSKNSETKRKEKLKKDEASKRLAQEISMVDDDHLDLSLEKEENFLNQYLSLLIK